MKERSTILALLGLAALVAAAVWAFSPAPAPVEHDDPAVDPAGWTRPRPTASRAPFPRAAAADRSVDPAEDQPDSPRTAALAPNTNAAGRASAPADAGSAVPSVPSTAAQQWEDPTNAEVLGQKQWMAPVEDAEALRIERVFEAARAARHDPRLPDRSRAASIEAARQVIDRCFGALADRHPGIQGRLIVGWTAGASGGRGVIRNPRIAVNYKLSEPQFEACVLDGLAGQAFRGPDGDPIEIQAPFFYDGAF